MFTIGYRTLVYSYHIPIAFKTSILLTLLAEILYTQKDNFSCFYLLDALWEEKNFCLYARVISLYH